MEWNGDVDLGDGKCQSLHQEYVNRTEALLPLTSSMGVVDEERKRSTTHLLRELERVVSKDIDFLHECKSVIVLILLNMHDRLLGLVKAN